MKFGRIAALFLGAIAASSFGTVASALGTHTFSVNLTGQQEVPPVAPAGSGFCTVTLDDVTGAVSVTGTFSNMTSTATAAHLHGPAAPGVNAGILITLSETGGTSGSVSGGGVLSAANVTNMLNGLTYLNIHTTNNPGGEARGQVTATVPAMPLAWTIALTVLALAGASYVLSRRRALPVAV